MTLPASVVFAATVDAKTYRLHNRSQTYNGKMAAWTAKLVKCMEIIMESHKFEESDPVTKFSILRHFKRACHSDCVSEDVKSDVALLFCHRQIF